MDFTTGGFVDGNLLITSILIVGLIAASLRANILDKQGIIAAALLGLFVGFLGHWTWLLLLLCFLLSSHIATKWRFEEKTERGLNESTDGHRGWVNVAANGGMPALVALLTFLVNDWESGLWMFAAAVAVATSDTWASEIGCLDHRVRMITTLKPCETENVSPVDKSMSIISILPEKFTGAFEVIVSMVSVTESSYTCVPLMLTDITSVVVSSPTVGGMEADCLHCVALIAPTCGTRYALK